jgi:hypothetical protein
MGACSGTLIKCAVVSQIVGRDLPLEASPSSQQLFEI